MVDYFLSNEIYSFTGWSGKWASVVREVNHGRMTFRTVVRDESEFPGFSIVSLTGTSGQEWADKLLNCVVLLFWRSRS